MRIYLIVNRGNAFEAATSSVQRLGGVALTVVLNTDSGLEVNRLRARLAAGNYACEVRSSESGGYGEIANLALRVCATKMSAEMLEGKPSPEFVFEVGNLSGMEAGAVFTAAFRLNEVEEGCAKVTDFRSAAGEPEEVLELPRVARTGEHQEAALRMLEKEGPLTRAEIAKGIYAGETAGMGSAEAFEYVKGHNDPYKVLEKLTAKGWAEESREPSTGRREYAITPLGRTARALIALRDARKAAGLDANSRRKTGRRAPGPAWPLGQSPSKYPSSTSLRTMVLRSTTPTPYSAM